MVYDDSGLKEKLAHLTRGELEELVIKLYHNNKPAREGLDFYLNKKIDREGILEKAKSKLRKAFFSHDYWNEPSDFEEVTPILEEVEAATLADPELYGEVLLYTVETAVERAKGFTYAEDKFYRDFDAVIEKLMDILKNNRHLFDRWKDRLDVLVEPDDEFLYFGTKDHIIEAYEELPWVKSQEA